MNRFRHTLQSLALLTLILLAPTATWPQATRTWVSGTGNDVNPCSRTAPCKTFAGAVSKTAINGEINCLDPGSFQPVLIFKSLTINCADTLGSILASNSSGIVINLSTTVAEDPLATVRLRGLSINGTGPCGPSCGGRAGDRGIYVQSANSRPVKLFIESVFIHGFVNEGLFFNGPGGELSVRNSSIIDNGGSGIRTLSTLAGQPGIVQITIDQTHTDLNQLGVSFDGNSFGVVKDSSASSNTSSGYVTNPSSIGDAEMTVRDSTANNNKLFGVYANQAANFLGTVRIANLTAIHNSIAQLAISGGATLCTNQKNHIGTPSGVPSPCFPDQ